MLSITYHHGSLISKVDTVMDIIYLLLVVYVVWMNKNQDKLARSVTHIHAGICMVPTIFHCTVSIHTLPQCFCVLTTCLCLWSVGMVCLVEWCRSRWVIGCYFLEFIALYLLCCAIRHWW